MAQAPLFRLSFDLCFGYRESSGKGNIRVAWEDDVLASYEQQRTKSEQAQWAASQRLALLENGQQHAWNTLRAAVNTLCKTLNEKSGREILESTDPRFNNLKIEREDRELLLATFDPHIRVATFESDAVPFTRHTYELGVKTIDGDLKVVWQSTDKKVKDPQDIAQTVLADFLSAGHKGQ